MSKFSVHKQRLLFLFRLFQVFVDEQAKSDHFKLQLWGFIKFLFFQILHLCGDKNGGDNRQCSMTAMFRYHVIFICVRHVISCDMAIYKLLKAVAHVYYLLLVTIVV